MSILLWRILEHLFWICVLIGYIAFLMVLGTILYYYQKNNSLSEALIWTFGVPWCGWTNQELKVIYI